MNTYGQHVMNELAKASHQHNRLTNQTMMQEITQRTADITGEAQQESDSSTW